MMTGDVCLMQGFFRQQTPGAPGQGDGGGVDAPAFNDAEFPTLGTGAEPSARAGDSV